MDKKLDYNDAIKVCRIEASQSLPKISQSYFVFLYAFVMLHTLQNIQISAN